LLFGAAGRLGRLDRHHWDAVQVAAAAIESRRGEPDAGIWELDNERWAHSRLTCAAGLRSVAGIVAGRQAISWADLADAIAAEVDSDCVHPSGRWQRSPGDGRPDASLLLPALRGAVPVDDPRSQATGLYTEEFDVAQRQLRGNFPQAFVHGLLLESAAPLGSSP
jgi:GH15 family glucan-1,4-alpha-glucosidase